MTRRHYAISGIVQGVGFRPFVFRLATELGLSGWVRNSPAGVELELQGRAEQLSAFSSRLLLELPPLAAISSLASAEIPLVGDETNFVILPSSDGRREVQIAPDTALCADCQRELFDPADRRYRHPFITCTNCGPRWTIVTGIPYDRPLTTMAAFPLCPACEAEYRNPLDRRFHAQPIACPDCGPQIVLFPLPPGEGGQRPGEGADPLGQAIALLHQGRIVAVKGLGGYHLAVDAGNTVAVARLRQRKQRDEKPFAVMVSDLTTARQLAELSGLEERLLAAPEAPVVIVRRRADAPVADLVAPGSRWVGLMLAYTPLHQLLFRNSGDTIPNHVADSGHVPKITALVMTSANASDEPMIADDQEVREKLTGIADAILTHNRPIQVRTDDSVLRVFQGRPLFYRRSRGYVPRPVLLPFDAGKILAVGAELKNTICLTRGNQAFLSQHIGDLKNEATLNTFQQTIRHLGSIMEIKPELVVCDQHPDYLSTRYAEELGLPLLKEQHHHAHMAACMAENGLDGDLIGVIFDGTGLGDDGTVWGGEFLVGGYADLQRAGHLKQVRLPGGDLAAREPWRMLLAWLWEPLGEAVWHLPGMPALAAAERKLLQAMLERGIHAPLSSSAGRLFDAAAFLVGAATLNSFDGQAGMALEALAETVEEATLLPYHLQPGVPFQLDLTPLLRGLLQRLQAGESPASLAWAFHASLATAVVEGCELIRKKTGFDRVVLSGGVFQNRLLTELVYTFLAKSHFSVFIHRLVPPNDGGIALGQAAIAARR
ncbi:MAG: carbamoyltransferase HypF [Geobacter sp.]|nr:carbamoyltransferase HypF [Geobacter sp.]